MRAPVRAPVMELVWTPERALVWAPVGGEGEGTSALRQAGGSPPPPRHLMTGGGRGRVGRGRGRPPPSLVPRRVGAGVRRAGASFLSLGARERTGAGVGRAGALALFLEARRMIRQGLGRAGAPSLLLGAGSIGPSRLRSSRIIAAGLRLLLLLAGAAAGVKGVFCVAETHFGTGGGF